MTRKLTAIALALGVVSAGALPASAQVDPALAESWEFVQKEMPGLPYSVLEAACKEGALMIYHGSWSDAQIAIVNAFRQKFPCITVQRFESTAAQLRQRFLAEARAGRNVADIIQDTDAGSIDLAVDEGLIKEHVITNDAAYGATDKRSGYWYPMYRALVGIAWNTTLVSEEEAKLLSTWEGILDPIWKGRAGVIDAANGQTNLLPWYSWKELYGEDFIRKVAGQQPRVFAAAGPASTAIGSGDVAVLFHTGENAPLNLWLAGAPVRWSLPEPALSAPVGQAIVNNAPHPNAAILYQEYAFSEAGYSEFQGLGGAPARLDYQDRRKVAEEPWYKFPTNFYEYDRATVSNSQAATVEMFKQIIRGGN